MSHSPICIMITILIYLGAMLYIGIRCSKSSNTVDDFYLGGRKLGPVVTAMSVFLKHWMLLHYHSSFSKDFAVKTGQSAALQQS